MSFTHDDVQRIISLLNTSHFDELLLETGGIKLELRRNGAGSPHSSNGGDTSHSSHASPTAQGVGAGAGANEPAVEAGLIEIRAPMLGAFYRSPKPGADPFVSIGSLVAPDTVIGIIEVMKLMNSAAAAVSGEIVEILAKDGELVEYEQVLMRVRC